jgi:2-dehydro-3-deoxyphosphogluconate aldolase/(4S)-4-hydroxy-2-oxoglutarate aldolase
MRAGGLVPLYASADSDRLYRLAELIVEVGIGVLEVTLRVPDALEALGGLVARIDAAQLPLQVGAGTVLDSVTAGAVIDAGARFVVSPVVDPAVGARCRAGNVPWIPGCATPTEIKTALDLGCSAVKLFPADAIGGPRFLRSVRAVFPNLMAISSGGVIPEPEPLSEWFAAGAVAVAMGSRLLPLESIETGEWGEVRRRLAAAVSAVATARRMRRD